MLDLYSLSTMADRNMNDSNHSVEFADYSEKNMKRKRFSKWLGLEQQVSCLVSCECKPENEPFIFDNVRISLPSFNVYGAFSLHLTP